MLKNLCGHSLKENDELWQTFMHLKTARNHFVHEGRARVGTETVTPQRAAELVAVVDAVVAQIRDWIPEQLRWPVPTFQPPQISWFQPLFQPQADQNASQGDRTTTP
jgi:hypothetical protein